VDVHDYSRMNDLQKTVIIVTDVNIIASGKWKTNKAIEQQRE
jgi:hypothetical protein